MKKWYYWLGLAGIWVLGSIMNYFEGRRITSTIIPLAIFLILALCQFICDKHGEKGARIFKYVCIGGVLMCIVFVLVLIFNALH